MSWWPFKRNEIDKIQGEIREEMELVEKEEKLLKIANGALDVIKKVKSKKILDRFKDEIHRIESYIQAFHKTKDRKYAFQAAANAEDLAHKLRVNLKFLR